MMRRQDGWSFAPHALLRTACLPAELGAGLGVARVSGLLERLERLRAHVLVEREQLSELLHEEVRRAREQDTARRALINLRRDLYQLKTPSARVLETLGPVLAPDVLARVHAFLAVLAEQRALRGDFAGTVEAEHVEQRRRLQEWVRAWPDFHAALDVASASLGEHLVRYQAVRPEAASAPWRSLENSLVSYVVRASLKTSALSRFAWSSVLAWPPAEADAERLEVELEPGSFQSQVALNRGVLRVVFMAVRAHPELSLHLRYRLNPDLRLEGEHAYVFVRTWGERVSERHGRLPLTAAHRGLLDFVAARGALSLVRIAESLGAQVPRERGLALLRKLVDAGLLVPELVPGDDASEELTSLLAALRESPLPLAGALATGLEEVHAEVARYAAGDGPTRVASRLRLRARLTRLLAELAPDAPPALPERLLYENALASVRSVRAPRALTRPEASEAGLIVRLASLLDLTQLSRLRDVETFVRQHGVGGECRNVFEFLLSTPEGRSAGEATPESARYVEELRGHAARLTRARQAFFDALGETVAGQRGVPEVVLAPEWVEGLLEEESLHTARAFTLVLQPAPRHDAFVLNAVFPGYGAMLSRFIPLVRREPGGEAVVGSLLESLERLARPARPAQLVLSSGHSVNVFPTLTAQAIHSAGAPPAARPLERELRLGELSLHHSPERHRLELKHSGSGEPVLPLYLGLLATGFLPPVDRRLIRLSPMGLYRPSFVEELEQRAGPTAEPVRAWPRLRLGPFILARRTWVVLRGEELERLKGEEDLDYWLRVRAWAERHGLPRRFFFYPAPGGHAKLAQGDLSPEAASAWFKPQYVDLDSLYSLHAWERLCRGMALPWHLQEVLPTPEEASVTIAGRAHVGELCVEVHLDPET